MVSVWDNIRQTLVGGAIAFDPVSGTDVASPSHVFLAVMDAFPLIMAALILVLGVWALFSGPGRVRGALLMAAAAIVAVSLLGSVANSSGAQFGFVGPQGQDTPPLASLGGVIFVCGAFFAITAAFLARLDR